MLIEITELSFTNSFDSVEILCIWMSVRMSELSEWMNQSQLVFLFCFVNCSALALKFYDILVWLFVWLLYTEFYRYIEFRNNLVAYDFN